MRVIAGSARRLLLKAPQGLETRPTSDKVKETLFNMLMPYLYDTAFLDLYAGSGAIGIEALSRGARKAVFVEKSKAAIACIQDNLKTTHFEDVSAVYKSDVFSALYMLKGKEKFDIVFMDPPYTMGLEKETLMILSQSGLLNEDALVIVECSIDNDLAYVSQMGYEIEKVKEYKNNKHIFLRLRANSDC